MDLGLDDVQEELVASFSQLLAKQARPEDVRAAEPGGFDPALWRTLLDTGALAMSVPESRGGWGASLLDLALVAEQLGRAVAPAPVIETQVAARLLAATGAPAALGALEAVLGGGEMVTVALHRVGGHTAPLVPAGAVCDGVVVLDGDRLRLVPVTAEHRREVRNLASAPLADIDVRDRGDDLVSGDPAVEAFERAVDEWLVLTAAAAVGIGTRAHELGCEYAKERRAFGAPIGSFQGVSHPLANDATNLDGARLLAWKAAWALDRDDPRGRELAAMAFAFAARTADAATYDALHVHGGYGFMLEYDVQLYHRRARGWTRVWGDAEAGRRRAETARYGTSGGVATGSASGGGA